MSADRAVVTGARNFARTSGGAIGLAISNTILNNLFAKNLPAIVSDELKAQLRKEFSLPAGISDAVRNAILDAYMVGIRNVFVFFVPVMGLCFLIGLVIRDISLNDPERPVGVGVASVSDDDEKMAGVETRVLPSSSSPAGSLFQEETLAEFEGAELGTEDKTESSMQI